MRTTLADLVRANIASFEIEIEGIDAELLVSRFTGEERISRPFSFSIQVESDALNIDPADAVGQKVTFGIFSQGNQRQIVGIVSRFEFTGIDREVGQYSVEMKPALYQLSQNYQSRIFQEKTAPDILKEVLESAGIPSDGFSISCDASYTELEYCVQYRESDLNFFNRLAERFGIFYFFDFTEDETKLIIGDSPGIHSPISGEETIPYSAADDTVERGEYIKNFRSGMSLVSSTYVVRDYNFKQPDLDLTKSEASSMSNDFEWYDYPGCYNTQTDGAMAAKIKMEADDCLRSNGTGASNSVRLAPGLQMTLEEHPVETLNETYLLISVKHVGSQPTRDSVQRGDDSGYSNKLQFQLAEIPFRPQTVTRLPRVEGSQTATVTGPSGEEIFSDEYGRVKVRFHWDRSETDGDKSSCWVRVSQTWASYGWGTMFIPRIHQEVIVNFLEGDPDRPIITGCVYNGANMPPYPLPDKQTVSTIKSISSPNGGGTNEIRFEDLKGSEEVYHHAQKDMNIAIGNNRSQTIGNDETLDVGNNRTRSVGKDESVSIGENRTVEIGKNESITVGKDRSISIGANKTESVGGDESVSVTGNRSVSSGKDYSLSVGKDSTIAVDKNLSESIGDSRTIQMGKDLSIQVGKKCSFQVGDSVLISGDKDITFKCGSGSITIKKNGDIEVKGKKISIKGSGDVSIKGSKVTQN